MSEVVRIVTTVAVAIVSMYLGAGALKNLVALVGQIAALILFLWLTRFVGTELGAGSLFHADVFQRASQSAADELLWNNVDRLIAALEFVKTFQK